MLLLKKHTVLKILLIMLSLYIGFLMIDRVYIFSQLDKSLDSSYYLEYVKENKGHPQPPVYLVSYAGRKSIFFKNQNGQALSAINNGIDHILMFKKNHIEPEFYQKNKRILDIPAGDGLWIWKPHIMLQAMKLAPRNSIIMYADGHVVFKKPITPFLKILEKDHVLLLLDGTPRKSNVRKISEFMDRKFIEHFGLKYEDFLKTNNLWSCFVAVKNNEVGRAFVEQWLKNCESGLLDMPYYDQSSLVIASQQKPTGVYVMNTDEMAQVIKNVHRHSNEEYKSLLPDIVSRRIKWFKVSAFGYNAKWLQGLRRILDKDE